MQATTFQHTTPRDRYSQDQGVNETVLWLLAHGYPALPIAPRNEQVIFNQKLLFTGKNPSYLNRLAQAIVVPHQQFQTKLPTTEQLKRWFQHPSVGVATMGGWQSTLWLDVDSKHFESRLACEMVVQDYLERTPDLKATYIERTQSGGFHIAFRCQEKPTFTRCSTNGQPLGELIGEGRVCVLAPTRGVEGHYEAVQRTRPRWVSSLEAVSLQPTNQPVRSNSHAYTYSQATGRLQPGQVSFSKLCSERVSLLLERGAVAEGQRSDLLVSVAREAFGWEQFAATAGISVSPDAEAVCFGLGQRWGLSGERIQRILDSSSNGIPIRQSHPGLFLQSGYTRCLERLSRCRR
ncbi:MAG: bifunctional DNA primase/polymerase [Stenomitos frigidus ULC029]